MNAYEYLDLAKTYAIEHADQRIGQAMMHCLKRISPIAYNGIPEDFDPFYDDAKVKDFIKHIILNWAALTRPIHQVQATY